MAIKELPILYSFRRCPYAIRARLALYCAKIAHEHREVDLKNKCQELLAISPKGTIPVMKLPDGVVLEESLDIMIWAMSEALTGLDKDLINENDTSFKFALDRYKYPNRYPEQQTLDHRGECLTFIRKIEILLQPFLSGKEAGLVDFALFPFARQFAHVDPNWFDKQPLNRVKSWLNFFSKSALFHNVMTKYNFWSNGDERLYISFV